MPSPHACCPDAPITPLAAQVHLLCSSHWSPNLPSATTFPRPQNLGHHQVVTPPAILQPTLAETPYAAPKPRKRRMAQGGYTPSYSQGSRTPRHSVARCYLDKTSWSHPLFGLCNGLPTNPSTRQPAVTLATNRWSHTPAPDSPLLPGCCLWSCARGCGSSRPCRAPQSRCADGTP